MVGLPLPEGPTIAHMVRAGTLIETPVRTGSSGR